MPSDIEMGPVPEGRGNYFRCSVLSEHIRWDMQDKLHLYALLASCQQLKWCLQMLNQIYLPVFTIYMSVLIAVS